MPKQVGEIKLTGTFGGITFYEMNGAYYARSKSSLDKKKVMKHASFAGSRERMKEFGQASRWCSAIYRSLPAKYKGRGVQQKMNGRAHAMFLEGKSEEEVTELLLHEFGNR